MTNQSAERIAEALESIAQSIDNLAAKIPLTAGREAIVLHCETFHTTDEALKIKIIK